MSDTLPTIDKKVPLPPRKGRTGPRGSKYDPLLADMEVDDSIPFDVKTHSSVYQLVKRAKAAGVIDPASKWSVRPDPQGVATFRLWRTA